MRGYKILSVLFLVFVVINTGCELRDPQEKLERQQISDYIKALGDSTYVLYPSGLYYFEIVPGTGVSPMDGDTAFIKFHTMFLDYVWFDYNKPASKPYKGAVGTVAFPKGVNEGLKYMHVGGKAKLLTPSSLAYGFKGIQNVVPGSTPVLWYIELDSVKAVPGK
ncbi:MAG TPA: FKBP-type peptidyl-prolyl cis-trans isomerase [Bacteroidales bacterium]|nr:FKBP-type peptidyl-prolyl cis-trans isomerase [Bacteroidales bacterium]